MEKFDKRFPIIFLTGVLVLIPLSPLFGYIAWKIRVAYKLDFTVGLYLATAPNLVFFMVMGAWFLKMYLDQMKYNEENGRSS